MWHIVLVAVALLIASGTGVPVPCLPNDLWALCQLETLCAFDYRDDGIVGVQRAIEFYANRNWQPPQWPTAWQPAPNSTYCDYGGSATTAAGFIASGQPLTPSLALVLGLLKDYRQFEEGSTGCAAPQVRALRRCVHLPLSR
jgi:hypothetical protein